MLTIPYRERSGLEYLHKASPDMNPISVVKMFCTKTEREIVESMNKVGSNWCMSVSIMGAGGENIREEANSPAKQTAKTEAYAAVLKKFLLKVEKR